MRVYTRKGDNGQTSLLGGARVSKASVRVEACGDLDELNSAVGAALACSTDGHCAALLLEIQSQLLDMCTELAHSPDRAGEPFVPSISDQLTATLEHGIDLLNKDLPPLQGPILPGGSQEAALLHVARSVCRRAERRLVGLASAEPVRPELTRYLNRLSDLLFVMARHANHRAKIEEVGWKSSGARE